MPQSSRCDAIVAALLVRLNRADDGFSSEKRPDRVYPTEDVWPLLPLPVLFAEPGVKGYA
jgi:hypothetical protein